MNRLDKIIPKFIEFVRDWYQSDQFIALHEPRFAGNEKQYLTDTINSTFVSSVGEFVDTFEQQVAEFTGANHAIATTNGTCALQIALLLAGVNQGDEVITQSLTFVGTTNAIKHCSANPVFIDIDETTLGLSADDLAEFLENRCQIKNGQCYNKQTGNRIAACLPVHIFGEPVKIDRIINLCDQYRLPVVEDAAEALGSFIGKTHCGTSGLLGILSFNGNKIITTGGGGMILTNDPKIAQRAKHLTTTAKLPHPWHYRHDQVGFNYRLPNVNAALGCAQMQQLTYFLHDKKQLSTAYRQLCKENQVHYINGNSDTYPNFWLNALLLSNIDERDEFLEKTNEAGIMTRPAWTPMHKLSMYKNNMKMNLPKTEDISRRLVNLPSSARIENLT